MSKKSSEESDHQRTKNNIDDAYNLARDFFDNGHNTEALDLTEKTISDHGDNKSCYVHHELQGDIYFRLARKQILTDVKSVYLFASVAAYSVSTDLFPDGMRSYHGYTRSLIQLGDHLKMNKFYGKAVSKAKRGLSVTQSENIVEEIFLSSSEDFHELTDLINLAESKIAQMKSKNKDPYFDRLKSFWAILDDKIKKEFLVVNITQLTDFIENRYGSRVKEYFRECVTIIDTLRWRCWKCHICSQLSYCFTDCKMHIIDKHVHKFEPEFSARPKYVDGDLTDMISYGDWKPVDTSKATTLIMDRTKRKEDFVYVNGWCSDWPVAEDRDRKNILQQVAEALKASCSKENRTLSCSLWEWLIDYTEEHLELQGVPGSFLDKCSFFKTPQCICFLDKIQLEHILKYFRQITTDVRPSLVSKVVNKIWENSQVKERIDLEGVITYNLLLDKRLLYEEELEWDKIETIKYYKSTRIYEDVMPKGDNIISWVFDCPNINEPFVSQVASPMAKGVQHREIWLAALRIVQSMVRKRVSYYEKRQKMLIYDKMLGEVETICDREDNRMNSNQRRGYGSTLQVKCEELGEKQDDDTKFFLNVVRDILESQESPRFKVLEDKEIKEWISRLSTTIQNDVVKANLLRLRKTLKEKFGLIDSKILLNESTYQKLIEEFPKLSTIEYRLVVLPFVKKFLQDKLKEMMKRNRNSVAAGEHKKRRV